MFRAIAATLFAGVLLAGPCQAQALTKLQQRGQALAHPQVAARGMVVQAEHPTAGTITMTGVPVRLSDTPGEARGRAPLLGEHTASALTSVLGLSDDDVASLRKDGALG